MAIMRKMRKLAKKGELDLEDKAFDPIEEPPASGHKVRKKKGLSEDIVHNSDDEAEATATTKYTNDTANADEELVVPETQPEQVAGPEEESEPEEGEAVDLRQQFPNVNQNAESLRSETPHLSPAEFMEKCKKAGKRQHRAYMKGYGR